MEIFYDILQKQVQKWNKNDYMIIVIDLNLKVGKQRIHNCVGISTRTNADCYL